MAKGKQRDRQLERRWRRIVREHQHSGLSVRQFCRRSKLTETAFYFWRGELQRRQGEQEQRRRSDAPAQAAFIPVHIAERAPAGGGPSEFRESRVRNP